MDDVTKQNALQQPQPRVQSIQQPVVQAQQPIVSNPQVTVQQTVSPSVSVSHKEQIVGGINVAEAPLITPSEKAPIIPQEVQQVGVEAVSEQVKLTQEHLKAGLTHAKESTPVSTEPTALIQFPMTAQQVQQTVQRSKVSDSVLWFALLILRQMKIAHQKMTKLQ